MLINIESSSETNITNWDFTVRKSPAKSSKRLDMFLYESDCRDMIKSFKRSGGLLCLVDILSAWTVSSGTKGGDADSPTQSPSMGDDARLTKEVIGSGPGDATRTLLASANGATSPDMCVCCGSASISTTNRSIIPSHDGGATSLRNSAAFHVSVGGRTRIVSPAPHLEYYANQGELGIHWHRTFNGTNRILGLTITLRITETRSNMLEVPLVYEFRELRGDKARPIRDQRIWHSDPGHQTFDHRLGDFRRKGVNLYGITKIVEHNQQELDLSGNRCPQ